MMTVVLLILAALVAVMPAAAQPEPVECPLPPYQLPLQPPERGFIDESGQFFVSGQEAPVELPDGLLASRVLWSDDGEVALIEARGADNDYRVFSYQDGALTEVLNQEELQAIRDEEFSLATELYNPAFVPGMHTVLTNMQLINNGERIYFEIPQDLWRLDLESGEFVNLIPFGEAGQFSIAPDGQSIVLMNFDTIWQTDINGENSRRITGAPSIAMGLGETVGYPPIVWVADAEVPTFRTLLFPTYGPNSGNLSVPFEVAEFTLGEEIGSTLIVGGPAQFFPAVELSPDGYRVAQWEWDDNTNPQTMIISLDEPGAERRVIAEVDVESAGLSPFVRWDDETHLTYGFISYNDDGMVTSWRTDLCGDTVELEPYQAFTPGLQ